MNTSRVLLVSALVGVLLGPVAPARAGDVAASLQKLIDKGKPEVAAKKAATLLFKDPVRVDAPAIRIVWAEATFAVLLNEPDLIGAHLFLSEFRGHEHCPEVLSMAADLALEAARECGTEAAYLGVARQYPATGAAEEATSLAEAVSLSAARASENPDEARDHQLRYPWRENSEEVAELELDKAYSLAETRGTAAEWRRLITRYPEHPRLDEAHAQLEEVSWREMQEGSPTVADLWAYASEHPDTDRGWEAATSALGQSAQLQLPDGATPESPEEATWDAVLGTLTVDLGNPPPPGYDVDLRVKVSDGAGGWRPWVQAANQVAPQLGLPARALRGMDIASTELSGPFAQWRTALPICSADGQSVVVQVSTVLTSGEREQVEQTSLTVTGACPGSSQMLFTQLGDDLAGPYAVVSYDSAAGAHVVRTPGGTLASSWECSHVTAVDHLGVTVVCGARMARVGWAEGTMWVRKTDPSVPIAHREALAEMPTDGSLPLTVVSKGRNKGSELHDTQGNVLAQLDDRTPVLTPADASAAFGAHLVENLEGAPSVVDADEHPGPAGTLPIPEGSTVLSVQVDTFSNKARSVWEKTTGALGLGGRPVAELDLADKASEFMDQNILINLSGWMTLEGVTHSLLLVRDGKGEFDWYQVLPLAIPPDITRAPWTLFEWQDSYYLRAATPHPEGTLLFTIRDAGPYFAVETKRAP